MQLMFHNKQLRFINLLDKDLDAVNVQPLPPFFQFLTYIDLLNIWKDFSKVISYYEALPT